MVDIKDNGHLQGMIFIHKLTFNKKGEPYLLQFSLSKQDHSMEFFSPLFQEKAL